MHKMLGIGFENKIFEFGILSHWVLKKPYFWFYGSLRDNSDSVRRKRVPQVRVREDNLYSYRRILVFVEMILTRV